MKSNTTIEHRKNSSRQLQVPSSVKSFAQERLSFLKQVDISPEAKSVHQLEQTFFRAVSTLDDRQQAPKHLRTLVTCALAYMDQMASQQDDAGDAVMLKQALTDAENALDVAQLQNQKLHSDMADLQSKNEALLLLLKGSSVPAATQQASEAVQQWVSNQLYQKYGIKLMEIQDALIKILDDSAGMTDINVPLAAIKVAADGIGDDVLEPWDNAIAAQAHGHKLEEVAARVASGNA